MKKTLFISDLDGTLLNNEASVSDFTKKSINALTSKGVYFTIATARTAASVTHILKGLSLSVPAILMNGVCVYDTKKEQYIDTKYISKESFENFVSLVHGDTKISPFIYKIEDNALTAYYENMYSPKARAFAKERIQRYGKKFVHLLDFTKLSYENAAYFTISDQYELLLPYYEKLKKDPGLYIAFYRDTYSDNTYYLEACSSNASKSGGVRFLKEKYNFEKVCAFGDNTNDLPMFEASDICFAPENANNKVKEYADALIPKNTDDGVAKKLIELMKEL